MQVITSAVLLLFCGASSSAVKVLMSRDEDLASSVNWISAVCLTGLWIIAQLCIYAKECYAYAVSDDQRPAYLDQGKFASNRVWKPLSNLPQIDLWGR